MDKYAPHYLDIVFGTKTVPDDQKLKELAIAGENNPLKPRIYMACGQGDYMYEENLALRDYFLQSPYEYFYEDGEGIHDWKFWNEYIQKALNWLLKK